MKKMTIMFCVGIFFALSCFRVIAGEGRDFEDVRLDFAKNGEKILIKNGECKSIVECRKKQLMFVSPANNGISIQLWGGVGDKTVEEFSREALELFLKNEGMNVELKIFSLERLSAAGKPFWVAVKPKILIDFKRGD
jgi:hypothetical protein